MTRHANETMYATASVTKLDRTDLPFRAVVFVNPWCFGLDGRPKYKRLERDLQTEARAVAWCSSKLTLLLSERAENMRPKDEASDTET